MPRLSKVEDLMFPVKEHSVFVEIPNGKTKRRIRVPDKKAIVNSNNNRVLGIVSRGYRLVTNQQALDWAFECCETVFPETKPVEWQVTAADAPGTGSCCFIDLTHNSSTLDFSYVSAGNRPDAFGPFIRVMNSYNRQRALAFDIGFYARELGDNAYAVFNAITDIASHPPANRFVTRTRHSLQRLAGRWVSDFSKVCQEPGFQVDEYLAGAHPDAGSAN